MPCPKDRRKVDILITQQGLDELERASGSLEYSLKNTLSKLTTDEAKELNRILDKIRS